MCCPHDRVNDHHRLSKDDGLSDDWSIDGHCCMDDSLSYHRSVDGHCRMDDNLSVHKSVDSHYSDHDSQKGRPLNSLECLDLKQLTI